MVTHVTIVVGDLLSWSPSSLAISEDAIVATAPWIKYRARRISR